MTGADIPVCQAGKHACPTPWSGRTLISIWPARPSGNAYLSALETSSLRIRPHGIIVSMPKEMRHFATCKGETIVQVHATGPFKVNWVNPSEVQPPDAPAAAKPKS